MKTLAYIIRVFKTLPLIVELEIQNFTERLKKFSEVEKRAKEKQEIIQLIRTLDLTKDEVKVALNEAVEGNYKGVIQSLVQYIQKYSK